MSRLVSPRASSGEFLGRPGDFDLEYAYSIYPLRRLLLRLAINVGNDVYDLVTIASLVPISTLCMLKVFDLSSQNYDDGDCSL